MQRAKDIATQLEAIQGESSKHGGWEAWWSSLRTFQDAVALLPGAPYVAEIQADTFLTQEGYLFGRAWDCGYLLCPNLVKPKAASDRAARWVAPIEVITDIHCQQRRRGIDLIVVPIPPRPEVEPDKLVPGTAADQEVTPQRLQFIEALLQRDVEAVDVLPFLHEALRQGQPLSLKTDTHYSNTGAQVVAGVLAERLRRYDFIKSPQKAQDYRVKTEDFQVLTAYASFEGRLPAETTTVRRILCGNGSTFKPDSESPILLIGDSYTFVYANASASLAAQLSFDIGFPVAHIGMGAGGPAVPRRLAQMGTDGLAKHRVVIWAFVARYLADNTASYNQWEKIQLP